MIHSMGSFNHFMLCICICACMCDSFSIFAYRSLIRQISLNIKKREKKGKEKTTSFVFFSISLSFHFPCSFHFPKIMERKCSKSLKDNILASIGKGDSS